VSGRALGIELRRSVAPWAALVVLVVAVAFLYLLSGPWWKGSENWTWQWTSAALWERFLLTFLWPIAVGAGALQGLRDQRSGMGELLRTTPRPTWQRAAATAGAVGLLLAVAYLALFLLGAVQVIGNGGYFHLGWLPIMVVGALSLVAGAWLGMGVARTFPSTLTPPLLAVAALVGMAFLLTSTDVGESVIPNRITLLSPAFHQVRYVFDTVAASVNVGQAVWLTGLAATGFLLIVAGTARTRLVALLPVVLGAAVALPILPDQPYVVNTAATELVCRGQVCVTRLHESTLDALAGSGEEALRLLAKLPDAPTGVREVIFPLPEQGSFPRTSDTVPVHFDDLATAGENPDWTRGLLAGAGTPTCLGETDPDDLVVREMAARTVTAAWFLGDLKPVRAIKFQRKAVAPLAQQAWDALRALSAEEQVARVSAARAVGLSCRGDQLTALAGG
jgi:hypothetical protein